MGGEAHRMQPHCSWGQEVVTWDGTVNRLSSNPAKTKPWNNSNNRNNNTRCPAIAMQAPRGRGDVAPTHSWLDRVSG
jgi:hypothetical protein